MPALDWTKQNAFSMRSLTSSVNEMTYVPGRIGQLGLFQESGIATTKVMIENREGQLVLVPASTRGGPAHQNVRDRRKVRTLETVHLAIEDTVPADEIQNVRAFGSESLLTGYQQEVDQRFASMGRKLDATIEHLYIGAIKGIVVDADGTTEIYNLFDEFGINAPDTVFFDLSASDPGSGAVRKKCNSVIRDIEDSLGAAPYTSIHAMCGSTFFDNLVDHPECREAYQRWNDGQALRDRTARRTFFYAGIMFEEYRGKVGDVDFVEADEAHFFPTGVPELFRMVYAPADFVETVNTIGLPRYAKMSTDQEFQRWVKLHMQSNPLPYCTRPGVLIKGDAAAS